MISGIEKNKRVCQRTIMRVNVAASLSTIVAEHRVYASVTDAPDAIRIMPITKAIDRQHRHEPLRGQDSDRDSSPALVVQSFILLSTSRCAGGSRRGHGSSRGDAGRYEACARRAPRPAWMMPQCLGTPRQCGPPVTTLVQLRRVSRTA